MYSQQSIIVQGLSSVHKGIHKSLVVSFEGKRRHEEVVPPIKASVGVKGCLLLTGDQAYPM